MWLHVQGFVWRYGLKLVGRWGVRRAGFRVEGQVEDVGEKDGAVSSCSWRPTPNQRGSLHRTTAVSNLQEPVSNPASSLHFARIFQTGAGNPKPSLKEPLNPKPLYNP